MPHLDFTILDISHLSCLSTNAHRIIWSTSPEQGDSRTHKVWSSISEMHSTITQRPFHLMLSIRPILFFTEKTLKLHRAQDYMLNSCQSSLASSFWTSSWGCLSLSFTNPDRFKDYHCVDSGYAFGAGISKKRDAGAFSMSRLMMSVCPVNVDMNFII